MVRFLHVASGDTTADWSSFISPRWELNYPGHRTPGSPLEQGSQAVWGLWKGSQETVGPAWEWAWPRHSSGMCLGKLRDCSGEGRDFERVLGGACEAVAHCRCVRWIRERKAMQMAEATLCSKWSKAWWVGELRHGLVSSFWKLGARGNPRWFQGLEAAVNVKSVGRGALDTGHNLFFPPRHKDPTHRVVVRMS